MGSIYRYKVCDVMVLTWGEINNTEYTTRFTQAKTKEPVKVHLHQVCMALLRKRKRFLPDPVPPNRLVFNLPSHNTCTRYVKEWTKQRGIEKNITPKSGRLGKSIILQDKNVDLATVAAVLGHKTTRHVHETYKRHRVKDHSSLLELMPVPDVLPDYLIQDAEPVTHQNDNYNYCQPCKLTFTSL